MCNCMTELKANIARDLAVEHNVIGGVDARWSNTKRVSTKDKMQRNRVVVVPSVSITATYSQTTALGKPFKNATVESITIKPIHCMICGKKL